MKSLIVSEVVKKKGHSRSLKTPCILYHMQYCSLSPLTQEVQYTVT